MSPPNCSARPSITRPITATWWTMTKRSSWSRSGAGGSFPSRLARTGSFRRRIWVGCSFMPRGCCRLWRWRSGWKPAGGADVEAVLERLGRPRLTAREMDVMVLMQAGHSTKSIARSMRISPHTIKVHRRNIYEKLGVSTQAEVFALLSGRMAR
ncbi:response regulator transcription factor [Komagataeibacter swingsii]|uniref:response regulator transcription factor n=2 Tax=Komagataeibacter swingsii TaxID=215220 RepID=UPI00278C4B48|nr:helix-turn-helix transcriptional regulator [Komagataeibacter swingsii]